MAKDNNARALSDILSKKNTDLLDEHLNIGSREARIRFGKIVENTKTQQNQFVITEHGEPAAALIPISDLRILDWLKRQNLKDRVSNAVYSDMTLDDFKALLSAGGSDGEEDQGAPGQARGAA